MLLLLRRWILFAVSGVGAASVSRACAEFCVARPAAATEIRNIRNMCYPINTTSQTNAGRTVSEIMDVDHLQKLKDDGTQSSQLNGEPRNFFLRRDPKTDKADH